MNATESTTTVPAALSVMREVANLTTERSRDLDKIASRNYNGSRGIKEHVFGAGDYCSYYWSSVKSDMTHERYIAAHELAAEYRAALAHLESLVEWTEVDRIHFADNSIEVIEESSDGARRQRMVTAPSGDACF